DRRGLERPAPCVDRRDPARPQVGRRGGPDRRVARTTGGGHVKVAVIGGGIMGSGIAQVAAMSGHEVALRDVGEAELERASAAIDRSLARFVKSERATRADADAARGRVTLTTDL